MSDMRYLLGSGFYDKPGGFSHEFSVFWYANNARVDVVPQSRVIIAVASPPHGIKYPYPYEAINLQGNLGHIGDLLNGKDRTMCGWAATLITLALIAYTNETDLIYKEQDCLCFGNWVQQMYADMGDGDMVFGAKQNSPPYMPCAQSLILIRHRFLLEFVWRYIGMGDERRLNAEGKADNLPEDKFSRMREELPDRIKALSFGVDRERPIPFDAPVWYVQQLSHEEFQEIQSRGIV